LDFFDFLSPCFLSFFLLTLTSSNVESASANAGSMNR
jgi:hypothetical protein